MRAVVFLYLCCYSVFVEAQSGFTFRESKEKKKVEVLYNNKLVTAYCYFDSTEKPVVFPIKTLSGIIVTRGYPISPRPGERTDHPHQVGLWLNYESVNGLDFWNNSTAIAAEKKHLYGSIKHQEVLSTKPDTDKAELRTRSYWVDQTGKVLLEEITEFIFTAQQGDLVIDRTSNLKAVSGEVSFKDIKDGLLGLRVARELEMPSKQEDNFVDAQGNVTTVKMMKNDGVTGLYVNREGVKGDDTWGKRSRWTCLNGEKDGEHVSIAIIDHPQNVGAPTYWHARGYGLFAANPLGQKIFSEGKEELNFKLAMGHSVAFRFRIVVHSGKTSLSPVDVDRFAEAFAKLK